MNTESVAERSSIKAVFELIGITVMFLAEMLMVSRPTVYRYYDWYDNNLKEKLPDHVRELFDLAMSENGSKQAVLNRIDYIHTDLLNRRKVVIGRADGKVVEPLDPYHSGVENFLLKLPGSVLRDGTIVKDLTSEVSLENMSAITSLTTLRRKIDDVLKNYISDSFSSDHFYYSFPDHAYVACFQPPQFNKSRASSYYALYNYLDLIRDLLEDELVAKCDIKYISELDKCIIKALDMLVYLNEYAGPYDDEAFDEVIKELNRPTFDISLKKKWYVCVYIAVLVDEYPDESTSLPFMKMVEAVGAEDALAVSKDAFSNEMRDFTVYEKTLFGPFQSKDEARKVLDYLQMDWNSIHSSSALFDEAKEWLDQQKGKKNLNWGGE